MPWASTTAPWVTSTASFLVEAAARTRANWPGRTMPLGLGNDASKRIVPVLGSTLRSTNDRVPGYGWVEPSARIIWKDNWGSASAAGATPAAPPAVIPAKFLPFASLLLA